MDTMRRSSSLPQWPFFVYRLRGIFMDTMRRSSSLPLEKGESRRRRQGGNWLLVLSLALLCLPVLATDRAPLSPAYKDEFELNVFVMEPLARVQNGVLNGYRIGAYPARPLRNNPIYVQPKGFVEVTTENADTRISPHFKLRQFICKQQANYPHYVVLNERLLVKLELIVERLKQLGFKADTLNVMSGYRTPYYNKAIGNVTYSLHQWGRAADVFVDDNNDEMMDDLNKDGRIDVKDAVVLRDLIQKLFSEPQNTHLAGGAGLYKATQAHGPFVHVDVRGYSANW